MGRDRAQMAARYGAGERDLRNGLFGDVATVYHYDGEKWMRRVLRGVFWKEERILHVRGGETEEKIAVRLRVNFDGEAAPVQVGDVLMRGEGPQIAPDSGVEQIRRDHACCIVHAVADNTGRGRLAHWRIDGE